MQLFFHPAHMSEFGSKKNHTAHGLWMFPKIMTVLTSRIRKVDIRFFFQLKNQNRSLGWRLDDAAALSDTCSGKFFHFDNFPLIFKQPRFHNFIQVQFQLSLWFELEKPSKNKIVQLVVLVIHRNTNIISGKTDKIEHCAPTYLDWNQF